MSAIKARRQFPFRDSLPSPLTHLFVELLLVLFIPLADVGFENESDDDILDEYNYHDIVNSKVEERD